MHKIYINAYKLWNHYLKSHLSAHYCRVEKESAMLKDLIVVFSIILFTLLIVSANLEVSDSNADDVSQSQVSQTSGNSFRRFLSGLPGRRLGRLANNNRPDMDALRQMIQASPDIDWQQLTPPPVLEPNCYVEVQVTQRMPGKCTKLGGRIPACQAQDLVTIDYSSCQ